jgi:hypothetical protein
MKTVVAIFDAAEQLEDAVNRLATARLDAAVVDENSLAQEPGSVDPVGPALVPGAAAEVIAGRDAPNLIARRDKNALDRAFRARLDEDYGLPDDVIDAYATSFAHSGRFVLVRADDKDADRAVEMLRASGASRVNKHD